MSAKKDESDAASTNGKPSDNQDVEECFVIMPISDPDGYLPGHFQRVYEDLFLPSCERAGYNAVRADLVRQTNLIHLDVLQKIIDSPMAICDLSNRNPNVMFELGLRQAFDKPVVLVQEVGTPPIFDITPLRYAEYQREMLYRQVKEDQEKIANAITATKEAIKNSKSVNSIVKLLSLTHGASLTSISEVDKDTGLLQIIMAELGNLRSEVKSALGSRRSTAGPPRSYKSLTGLTPMIRATATQKEKIEYIEKYGIDNFLIDICGLASNIVESGLEGSEKIGGFLDYMSSFKNEDENFRDEIEFLYSLNETFLRHAYSVAKLKSIA